MKNLLIMLIILLSISSAETYEQCRERLNTPEKIAYFIKHELVYVYTPKAVPYRTPEEVFRSRSGGCTDKANFAYEMLTYHGYTAGLYELWNSRRGHAFVVYINEYGKYNCIESIYGLSRYNVYTVYTTAKLTYRAYGEPTGRKYVKGYEKWDLR